jgi:hypothetical protein
MTNDLEIIAAFIDGERVDASRLAQALVAPEGREYLVDLLALRELVEQAPARHNCADENAPGGVCCRFVADMRDVRMKSILVPTEHNSAMQSALDTALLLAQKFVGCIEGFAILHICKAGFRHSLRWRGSVEPARSGATASGPRSAWPLSDSLPSG